MPTGLTCRLPGLWPGMVLALCLCTFLLAPAAQAVPDIQVRAGDTSGSVGSQLPITVYLTTGSLSTDSVAAFTIWLKLNRPDIAIFHTTLSGGVAVGLFDTVGTLAQGFEYLDVRSTVGNGLDLLITGIAHVNGGAPKRPIAPGRSGQPLIKVYLDMQIIPDSTSDRTATIHIEKDFLDKYIFSRPDGSVIGLYNAYVPDTICYQCLQWVGNVCTNKVRISTPPCDLTQIVTDTVPTLDTTKVQAFDGSITALHGCCVGKRGNVNMVGAVDLGDLSALVSYLTGGGYILPCLTAANVNGVGAVDLGDLSALVSYLTGGGYVLQNCP